MRTVLLLVIVLIVGAQFVPVTRDNPPVAADFDGDAAVKAVLKESCYNCHSNETTWPWYSRIAPVGWVIWYDVTEGRQRLNFSDWDQHAGEDLIDPNDPFPPKTLSERITQVIHNGRMPPGTYRLMNPDARLSASQKEALIEGLVRTVKANEPSAGAH